MKYLIQKPQHPCWAEFKCFYKIGNTCTFRQQVETMLCSLQDIHHKGGNCIVNFADTYTLPCTDLDEDSRQHGIGNQFTDENDMHKWLSELFNYYFNTG